MSISQLPTVTSRLNIGFENLKESWIQAPAEYDDKGSLKILGHPVMEWWEESYMAKLAEVACQNGGSILEVGFGLGISASKIQSHDIKKHVIIEANYNVFNKLLDFAKNAQHQVIAIQGFWENCINHLSPGSFDGILFDTYPLSKEEIHKNHFPFFEHAYRLLKVGGVLTYYSDEKESFSHDHIQKLHSAGFSKIECKVSQLETPDSCQYWKDKTMIVPIIEK